MKEVGTLKELGVGVGDVVKHSDGTRYEIRLNDCGNPANWDIKCGFFGVEVSESVQQYSIVSRASDKPKLWRDMTPEEKGALLLAAHDGFPVQSDYGCGWEACAEPLWFDSSAYRIRPEPKVETVTLWIDKSGRGGSYRSVGTVNFIDGKIDIDSVNLEDV